MPGITQDNAHKQFIAIVAGEASIMNNRCEAAAIGSVMMNRLKIAGGTVTDNFIDKISLGHPPKPKKQYNAIGEKIYNDIMGMKWDEINNPLNQYAKRISGAMLALHTISDYSQGAYFWNATSDKGKYHRKIYKVTVTIGGTTFFKYKDPHRKKWP